MVLILRLSAKLVTPDFLKTSSFRSKVYDVRISFLDVINKILLHDSNYIIDVVRQPKFGNSSIPKYGSNMGKCIFIGNHYIYLNHLNINIYIFIICNSVVMQYLYVYITIINKNALNNRKTNISYLFHASIFHVITKLHTSFLKQVQLLKYSIISHLSLHSQAHILGVHILSLLHICCFFGFLHSHQVLY